MEIDHLDQNHENHVLSNLMLLHRHARYGALTETFEQPTERPRKPPLGADPGNKEKPSVPWDETEFQQEHKRTLERLRKLTDEAIPLK